MLLVLKARLVQQVLRARLVVRFPSTVLQTPSGSTCIDIYEASVWWIPSQDAGTIAKI